MKYSEILNIMKKKTAHKKTAKKSKNSQVGSYTYIRYISIPLGVILLILISNIAVKSSQKVLGAHVSPSLLADQGGDSQGDSNTSSDNQPSQEQHSSPTNQLEIQSEIHQPNPTEAPSHQTIETPQGKVEIQQEGNKSQVNLESAGTHIEMKQEDNGALKVTAHKEDGTEVQMESKSLDTINAALKERDIEVSSTSATGLSIRSGDTEAKTNLPLSLDTATKNLSVTTSTGKTDLTILPNQAVLNVLQSKLLSGIPQQAATESATNKTISLIEFNNQPAFAIQGESNKRLLGLFPMSFSKTVYVSAQNGQVLQTQEDQFNKILESISF